MLVPALFALAAGCSGYDPEFRGSPVWELFPFDGDRTWTYSSSDTAVSYRRIGTSIDQPEKINGKNTYTITYTRDCVGNDPDCVEDDLEYRVQWSSDISDGTFIWSYDLGDGRIDFRPPVQVTTDMMERDDSIETTTGGVVWTSTMLGIENCPILLTAEWPECGPFEVTADGIDGFPVAGRYWATKSNGIAAFELATENGRWQLSDLECEGECDGEW